jgi:hypothetical protein
VENTASTAVTPTSQLCPQDHSCTDGNCRRRKQATDRNNAHPLLVSAPIRMFCARLISFSLQPPPARDISPNKVLTLAHPPVDNSFSRLPECTCLSRHMRDAAHVHLHGRSCNRDIFLLVELQWVACRYRNTSFRRVLGRQIARASH